MVIVIVVAIVVIAFIAVLLLGPWGPSIKPAGPKVEAAHHGPTVAEFHVVDGVALVRFEVPLPSGGAGDVLADLLVREAIEVVRAKRSSLPLGEITRVVAFGRNETQWSEVGSVELETPGMLPPPLMPEPIPHASRPAFDVFDRFSDLPEGAPGLADERDGDALAPLGPELRLPSAADAWIRAQGIDPGNTDAVDLMMATMQFAGYEVSERAVGTYDAVRGQQRIFVRMVRHAALDHPELGEEDVDRFVVDFMLSRAERGLLITEKYSPYAIYERERREPRMRFITRERFQSFIDALTLG